MNWEVGASLYPIVRLLWFYRPVLAIRIIPWIAMPDGALCAFMTFWTVGAIPSLLPLDLEQPM